MAPTIIEGEVKNGKIIPKKTLPKAVADMHVQILLTPKASPAKERMKYRGSVPHGWGDPVKYQRKIRAEFER